MIFYIKIQQERTKNSKFYLSVVETNVFQGSLKMSFLGTMPVKAKTANLIREVNFVRCLFT